MKALLLLYIPKYHLFGDDAGDDLLGVYGGQQTYGSRVPFTDRLLTRDLFGLAPEDAPPALSSAVYSLAISPPLMIAALKASDAGRVGTAKGLIVLMAIGLAVAIAHDVVLVKQTAGSLTFLGAFFIVVLAPVFS